MEDSSFDSAKKEKARHDRPPRCNSMVSSLHIDAANPYITLVGKGRKSRNVPLMSKTEKHLKNYLKEFHPNGDDFPLFYSLMDGRPHKLSTDSIIFI